MTDAFEYFLSAYLTPPGDRSVISPRHDHNVALWRRSAQSVELVRYWELERISGQKHHSWPLYTVERAESFLGALLASEGLSLADVSASWGTPGLPGHTPIPVPAGAEELPIHSLAHLFSGMLLSTRVFREENIIGLAVDAAPDLILENRLPPYWYAGCVSRKGQLTFASVESPAPLFHAASRLFAREPGTLMALASASRTEMTFDAAAAVAEPQFFGGRVQPWPAAFALLKSIISEAERQLPRLDLDGRFTPAENMQSSVMKVVQRCSELITIRNIEKLCAMSDVRAADCYLSMGGGFALNCPTNTLLLDRFGFRGLLTPPCPNDSGQALGLGLLGLYGTGAFDHADLRIDTAYYGSELRDADTALAEFAPWVAEVADFSPDQFAEDVTDNVVAWVDGAAEMGPRALGHRSLLGDPRSGKVKDRLNECKGRQWWRPVAPLVLAEHAGDWFEQTRPSPFMLEAVQVRPEVRDRVPAILHLDGSARHQTLSVQANPLLHRAIDGFRSATGVPMLCNTSLNDKGEPIVDTAAEALTFCIRKGIQVAYLGGRRIALRAEPDPPAPVPPGPRPRMVEHFTGQEADRDAFWASWLERGYTEGAMLLLTGTPQLLADQATYTPRRASLLARRVAEQDDAFDRSVEAFRSDHGPGSAFISEPGQLPRSAVVSE